MQVAMGLRVWSDFVETRFVHLIETIANDFFTENSSYL